MKAGQALVSLAPVMVVGLLGLFVLVASRVETLKSTAGIQVITASVFMGISLAATLIMYCA